MGVGGRKLVVQPAKAPTVAAWCRRVGVSHAHQTNGVLFVWGVTPALREKLARDVGPLSQAEADYAAKVGKS